MPKLAAYNREIIQERSARTTYLMDPVKIDVPSHEEVKVEKDGKMIALPRGMHEFYVSGEEIRSVPQQVFRLRNAYNVRLDLKEGFSLQGKFAGTGMEGKKVVSWIFEMMDLELVLPDGRRELGAIEAMELVKGQHLYLEKKGFCIIDSAEGKRPVAYFTHE